MEKIFKRYLKSILEQTFTNFEVIIVDDKSVDKTYSKLKKETNLDKRFLIIRLNKEKKVNGPYLARNTAMDLSRGKYICFLDIDDYWLPNKLQRNYEILTENKSLKFIYSSYLRYDLKKKQYFLRSPIVIGNLNLSLNFYNPIPLLTVCFERDYYQKYKVQIC